jgi:hypothetical protein
MRLFKTFLANSNKEALSVTANQCVSEGRRDGLLEAFLTRSGKIVLEDFQLTAIGSRDETTTRREILGCRTRPRF